jgi:hypothetical protein
VPATFAVDEAFAAAFHGTGEHVAARLPMGVVVVDGVAIFITKKVDARGGAEAVIVNDAAGDVRPLLLVVEGRREAVQTGLLVREQAAAEIPIATGVDLQRKEGLQRHLDGVAGRARRGGGGEEEEEEAQKDRGAAERSDVGIAGRSCHEHLLRGFESFEVWLGHGISMAFECRSIQ